MAKEPVQVDTPESIAEMEERVRRFRANEQQELAAKQREQAKPLLDLVNSDGFAEVEAAVPALEQLAADGTTFPYLRDHVAAVRNGVFGLRQLAGAIPAELPAGEQIVDA